MHNADDHFYAHGRRNAPTDTIMLKTISKAEFYFFKSILKSYYNHIANNYNTMITRVYGLHKMMLYKSQKSKKLDVIHFVIMGNMFNTDLDINISYDLKGSLYKRTARAQKLQSG